MAKQIPTYKYLIGSTWQESKSGETVEISSAIDGKTIGKVQSMTKSEVNDVVDSSKKAFESWKNTTIFERGEILKKGLDIIEQRKEEIAKILNQEIAKPLDASLGEVERSIIYARFVIESAKNITGEVFYGDVFDGYNKGAKTGLLVRVPVGVVLAISPFNYPINLSMTKIIPALIAGNTVVFKPATQGALASIKLAECFVDAGLPAGVLNLITGRSSEIGDHTVTNPDIDLIAFTGSTEIGRHISRITENKILIMEMGGKDTAIVLEDADLDLAAKEIVKGAFSYSGQRCTAVKRVFVHEKAEQTLVMKIKDETEKLSLGALINEGQVKFVQSLIDDAKSKGAKFVLEGSTKGNTMQPSILTNVSENMRIFTEEQFGPVLPIVSFKEIGEPIKYVNASEYGLQADLFTQNINSAFDIAEKLNVGTVQINGKSDRGPDNFPFLGVKASGFGPSQATKESIFAMTREKMIVINKK
jgi:glyceraldehyde-3-phosphate dehydrogenase (NADP+)